MSLSRFVTPLCVTLALLSFSAGASARTSIIVSVADQKMAVLVDGAVRTEFPVSTSKFGIGSRPKSYATPLGKMVISGKVGHGERPGTVFKGRVKTGEVVSVNAKGRDPIVTRILQLRGLENRNANTESRAIYIHGTPEERNIGRPASYGCIRMKSSDIIKLFKITDVGTKLDVVTSRLKPAVRSAKRAEREKFLASQKLHRESYRPSMMATRSYDRRPQS